MSGVNEVKPSKSARKREHLALQVLGEMLIGLTRAELETLRLDEPLFEAVIEARAIRSHSALRRQRQLIGKLMRFADAADIESKLELLGRQDRLAKQIFHSAEEWRERICTEGLPAISAFDERTRHENTRLRKLVEERQAAASESAKRAIQRRIFREIHDQLTSMNENSPTTD